MNSKHVQVNHLSEKVLKSHRCYTHEDSYFHIYLRKKTLVNDSEEIECPNNGAQFKKCIHQECAKVSISYTTTTLLHYTVYDT